MNDSNGKKGEFNSLAGLGVLLKLLNEGLRVINSEVWSFQCYMFVQVTGWLL